MGHGRDVTAADGRHISIIGREIKTARKITTDGKWKGCCSGGWNTHLYSYKPAHLHGSE
jgi:hypothetical protein